MQPPHGNVMTCYIIKKNLTFAKLPLVLRSISWLASFSFLKWLKFMEFRIYLV